jgi:hypothetical protein
MRRCKKHRIVKNNPERKTVTVMYPGCGLPDHYGKTEFFARRSKGEFMAGTTYRVDGVEHRI